MTDSKHTPWKTTKFADGTIGIHAPDGAGWMEIAVLRGRFALDHASLLAAAPDLKEALAKMLDYWGGYECPEVDEAIRVMQAIGEDRWSMQAQMDAAKTQASPAPTAEEQKP